MYRKGSKGLLKHWDFVFLDLLIIQLAFWLAYCIRHGFYSSPYENELYSNMAWVVELSCVFVTVFTNNYKNVLKRDFFKEIIATGIQAFGVMALSTIYLFSVKSSAEFSRVTLYTMIGLYFLLSLVIRQFYKKVVIVKLSNSSPRSMLIVTSSNMAESVVKNLKSNSFGQFAISGLVFVDKDAVGETVDGVSVVTTMENITDYVCREWVDEVLMASPREYIYPQSIINNLITTGVTVHMALSKEVDPIGNKQIVEKIGGYTVLTSSMNTASGAQLVAKRLLDIIGGIIGCIITGILYIFLAPLIKRESPGNVFFAQERVGRNGKVFKMYKFRSMYPDAEERKKELMEQNRVSDGMMFKLDFDPRIIGAKQLPDGTVKKGVGNYIRDLSLDEFPQFFNVLKGDMSLVGTRPPTLDEWNKYELHHRARLAIKPGITGMWQTNGRSNITDFEEVVRLDTEYINEWNLLLDIKLLLKTVIVVFKKEGSM
ncbi:MAG: exopolysaccharide biosynthesis polyprenyl glycosylphosphotransferase [Oscillospiraceae bacterium]|nr:exopolysaccharide biosynthesis polyprenyl glycosylphosphotransferase [Oscillospiraceae bacterium]